MTDDDALGVRRTALDPVDGATLIVETPEFHADEEIGVAAYAYDDEVGDIELTLGTDVRTHLTLSPTAARQLADRLLVAADEAAADVDPDA
jgi:hypothetical protein